MEIDTTQFLDDAVNGNTQSVQNFLNTHKNTNHSIQRAIDYALEQAVGDQQVACVELLARYCSEQALDKCFKDAASEGWVEVVKTLLAFVSDNSKHFGLKLSAGSDGGCIELLLPFANERVLQRALVYAVDSENIDNVRMLLRHADPLYNCSEALQLASRVQCQEAFDLLYDVSNPHDAYKALINNPKVTGCEREMLNERMDIDRLNAKLIKETNAVAGSERVRKI